MPSSFSESASSIKQLYTPKSTSVSGIGCLNLKLGNLPLTNKNLQTATFEQLINTGRAGIESEEPLKT